MKSSTSFKSGDPSKSGAKNESALRMFLVPCSCGITFAVDESYDRQGMRWSRYMKCPNCQKRHDPKYRLLQIAYRSPGFWTVDSC